MGYTIPGLAKQIGVTPQTIRNWVNKDMIPSHIAPSGRTFFTDEDVTQIINKKQNIRIWAHYARSSCGSKTALQNQLDQLEEKYGIPEYTIKDSASGLNEKRKGLQKILDLARDKKITDIAITTEDRLTRFGYEYLNRYLTENGVKIHILTGTTEKQPEAELIDDFMALLALFSGRYYHLRSNKNEKKFLKDIENQVKDHNNAEN